MLNAFLFVLFVFYLFVCFFIVYIYLFTYCRKWPMRNAGILFFFYHVFGPVVVFFFPFFKNLFLTIKKKRPRVGKCGKSESTLCARVCELNFFFLCLSSHFLYDPFNSNWCRHRCLQDVKRSEWLACVGLWANCQKKPT